MHHYHHMQENLQDGITVRLFLLQQDLQDYITVHSSLLRQDLAQRDT